MTARSRATGAMQPERQSASRTAAGLIGNPLLYLYYRVSSRRGCAACSRGPHSSAWPAITKGLRGKHFRKRSSFHKALPTGLLVHSHREGAMHNDRELVEELRRSLEQEPPTLPQNVLDLREPDVADVLNQLSLFEAAHTLR